MWVNIFVLIAIIILCYYTYYFRFPHCYYQYLSFISPEAKIVDIQHTKEKWGRDGFIKTVVKFSDGFEYHTHKTFREPRLLYDRIYIDDEARKVIVIKALKAHDRIVRRKMKTFGKN